MELQVGDWPGRLLRTKPTASKTVRPIQVSPRIASFITPPTK